MTKISRAGNAGKPTTGGQPPHKAQVLSLPQKNSCIPLFNIRHIMLSMRQRPGKAPLALMLLHTCTAIASRVAFRRSSSRQPSVQNAYLNIIFLISNSGSHACIFLCQVQNLCFCQRTAASGWLTCITCPWV